MIRSNSTSARRGYCDTWHRGCVGKTASLFIYYVTLTEQSASVLSCVALENLRLLRYFWVTSNRASRYMLLEHSGWRDASTIFLKNNKHELLSHSIRHYVFFAPFPSLLLFSFCFSLMFFFPSIYFSLSRSLFLPLIAEHRMYLERESYIQVRNHNLDNYRMQNLNINKVISSMTEVARN